MTFIEALLAYAEGEPITEVVLGAYGWDDIDDTNDTGWIDKVRPHIPRDRLGIALSLAEAQPLLDYEWKRGFGAPSCYAIYAYTPSRVIFVSQYDGSTTLHSVPRNPCDCIPTMPGG